MATETIENISYPFTIAVPDSLDSDKIVQMNISNYVIGKHENASKGLGFEKFDALANSVTNSVENLIIGKISFGKDGFSPIDSVKNKTALEGIASFYNAQTGTANYASNYLRFSQHENLFDFYDYMAIEISALTAGENGKKFSSNVKAMYDANYCTMAYRSAKNNSCVVKNGMIVYETGKGDPAKLPVFSVETTKENPKAWVVVRGFKFEMRSINTSTNNYVFEYPEYLFKNGKYRNSDIDYIETTITDGTSVWYSYADGNNNMFLNENQSYVFSNVSEELQAIS